MTHDTTNRRGALAPSPDATLEELRPISKMVVGVSLGLVGLMMVLDLVEDFGHESLRHLTTEGGAMLLLFLGLGVLLRMWMRDRGARLTLHRRVQTLGRERVGWEAEALRWREEAQVFLRGLGEAIDEQFSRWRLTPAEREVALLQLKGLSHKEIAAVRGTSEVTVRRQANAIYRKAGIGSRSELAAFFLEDLLPPRAPLPGAQCASPPARVGP